MTGKQAKRKRGAERPENILVIQLRQLGDILVTTPCLAAIRRERPNARLGFLSHAMGRLIIENSPYVDEHLVFEDGWSLRQHARFISSLRARRYDLVLDFMSNPRSALFALASGAAKRVSWASARSLAYTDLAERIPDAGYIVSEKLAMMRTAGFSGELHQPPTIRGLPADPGDPGLVLPWFEQHTRPFMQLLGAEAAFRAAPLRIVLSPTHRRAVRRWPLAAYAELAARLVQDWGAAILWLWGPGEEEEVDQARALCRVPTWKAPRTSFREMAALLANCDLFIGNSNGPSHVAVAVNTCSLQLHGHTQGRSWCPPGSLRHAYVQAPDFGRVAMPDMAGITVDAVHGQLMAMRPAIEAQAKALRLRGPRFSWRD